MTRRRIATRNVLRHIAGGMGLLMVGFGTFLIASYLVGAFQVMDEADRSWLFWGLALAAQGLAIGGLGGLLVTWGHVSGQAGLDGGGEDVAFGAGGPLGSAALQALGPDDEVVAVAE